MDRTTTSTGRLARLSSERSLPLSVVILYDQASTAAKAAGLVTRVMDNLAGEVDAETSVWSFDVMRLATVAELASTRCAEADLLMVSSRRGERLPDHVARCLDTAMERRGTRSLAVAAVIKDQQGDSHLSPLCDDLKRLCCRAEGDTFFCTQPLPDLEEDTDLTPQRLAQRATSSSTVLESIMHRKVTPSDPYWGEF